MEKIVRTPVHQSGRGHYRTSSISIRTHVSYPDVHLVTHRDGESAMRPRPLIDTARLEDRIETQNTRKPAYAARTCALLECRTQPANAVAVTTAPASARAERFVRIAGLAVGTLLFVALLAACLALGRGQ
jgi:hypothetical protein